VPPGRCGLAEQDRRGEAYNEQAFQYLLSIERKRCQRSGRTFLLLLVDLEDRPAVSAGIDPVTASALLTGLRVCLREVDFVGWYRDRCVAGAVLTESRSRPGADVARLVAQRASRVLGGRLASDVAARLRVRVYRHPEFEDVDLAGVACETASYPRRT
jgi:hypothetical protein